MPKINNTAKNEIKLIIKKEFFEINFFGNWTVGSSADQGVEESTFKPGLTILGLEKLTFSTKKLN